MGSDEHSAASGRRQLPQDLPGHRSLTGVRAVQSPDAEGHRVEDHADPGLARLLAAFVDFPAELSRQVDRVVIVLPRDREAGQRRCIQGRRRARSQLRVGEDVVGDRLRHLPVGEAESERAVVELNELRRDVSRRIAIRGAVDLISGRLRNEEQRLLPAPRRVAHRIGQFLGPVARPPAQDGDWRAIALRERLHPGFLARLIRDLVPPDAQAARETLPTDDDLRYRGGAVGIRARDIDLEATRPRFRFHLGALDARDEVLPRLEGRRVVQPGDLLVAGRNGQGRSAGRRGAEPVEPGCNDSRRDQSGHE